MINKCVIKNSGCTETYDGVNLTIDTFVIAAKVDVNNGYKEEVCISCSTAEQS